MKTKTGDARDVRAEAQAVFEAWRDYQRAPDRCLLTEPRKRLLYARLRDHTGPDLCALVRYAFEADVPEARFWRGGNAEQREYLDLENLFRVGTLDSRVERALAWAAGEDPHDPDGPQDDTDTDTDAAPQVAPAPPPRPAPAPPPAVQPVRGRSLRRTPRT